jgi:hypothetical protein
LFDDTEVRARLDDALASHASLGNALAEEVATQPVLTPKAAILAHQVRQQWKVVQALRRQIRVEVAG